MRVLGIDPGYDRCGISILEKVGGKESIIISECIETSPKDLFEDRLVVIGRRVRSFIADYNPESLSIEKLYFNTNQKTAMHVAEARGVLLFTAREAGLSISEYTPGQIKVAITGHGAADKRQVIDMLRRLVRIDHEIRHDDEWDAIAVALTHLAHVR